MAVSHVSPNAVDAEAACTTWSLHVVDAMFDETLCSIPPQGPRCTGQPSSRLHGRLQVVELVRQLTVCVQGFLGRGVVAAFDTAS